MNKERIREEVLLNQDEIIEAVVNVYPPPEPATDSDWQIYTDAVREAIAQAQLDKVLKDKRVRLEADNQKLPENYHNKASLIITYNTAQQDMLKAGFVKCQEGKEKWGVKPVNKEEHGS